MTNEELTRLDALAAAATPGPWRHQTAANADAPDDYGAVKAGGTLLIDDAPDADCAFVCAARDAVPALTKTVRERDEEIARLRALVEAAFLEGQSSVSTMHGEIDFGFEQSDARKALTPPPTLADVVHRELGERIAPFDSVGE